jgi:secondary thiamine-phosphate synthase enzyme
MEMSTMEFSISTSSRDGMLDITSQVIEAVHKSGITDGLVTVFCPHTTAAITINENADADVIHDVLMQLDKMVPWSQPFFDHCEGISAAHVKSSMIGASETIPISGGKMTLGIWQGIYFCEFDGPRSRKFVVNVQ